MTKYKPTFVNGDLESYVIVRVRVVGDEMVRVAMGDDESSMAVSLDSLAVETLIRALSIALLEIKRSNP